MPTVEKYDRIVDLLVIGGGPHCLSAVTRVLEEDAYDKVDDRTPPFKRAKLILRKQQQQRSKISKSRRLQSFEQNVMIIDKNGEWMNRWNSQFEFFQIEHLRSTTRLHVDPYDADSLFLFAKNSHRTEEFKTLEFIARSAAFRGPFFLPSTKIFNEFCHDVSKRYQIHNLIEKTSAEYILPILSNEGVPFDSNNNPVKYFEVKLTDGRLIKATKLLVGVGSTNIKKEPDFVKSITTEYPANTLVHSFDLAEAYYHQNKKENLTNLFPSKSIINKKLLIVGGGLTSVYLVKVAKQMGFKSVDLIIRSAMSVKQFDVDVEWVGAIRTKKFREFRNIKSFQERAKCLAKARGSGSINPEAQSYLQDFHTTYPGFLTIREMTEVIEAYYHSPDDKSSSQGSKEGWEVTLSSCLDETEMFDYIWLGTGSVVDVRKEPLFSKLYEKVKVDVINGLPAIDNDLTWTKGCGAYIMGAYAALQLGPGALNLAGARTASSIISPPLQSFLFPTA